MTAGEPHFSIIVPAFNEAENLPQTLAALKQAIATAPWPGELVVCDNNSADATSAVARQGGARVVFEPVNQISRARNAGARAAKGQWFIFVDADTKVEPWLIHQAVGLLAQGATSGGGAQVTFAEGAPWSARTVMSLWNWLSRTMGYAAGCFVFCTREAFEGTGGFSESVYASEEIWFSRALGKWGRQRGQGFRTLPKGGIETSTRKLRWHNQWKVLALVTFFTVCPFAVRSRRFCSFWYRRPASQQPRQ